MKGSGGNTLSIGGVKSIDKNQIKYTNKTKTKSLFLGSIGAGGFPPGQEGGLHGVVDVDVAPDLFAVAEDPQLVGVFP